MYFIPIFEIIIIYDLKLFLLFLHDSGCLRNNTGNYCVQAMIIDN